MQASNIFISGGIFLPIARSVAAVKTNSSEELSCCTLYWMKALHQSRNLKLAMEVADLQCKALNLSDKVE